MRTVHSAAVLVGILSGVLVSACDGFYEPEGARLRPPNAEPASPTTELATQVSEGGLRVLTQYEYTNTVHALFGAHIVVPKLSHDVSVDGWTTVGAAVASIAPMASDDLESAALDIAKQVFDPSRREKVSPCAPTADPSDACTRQFVETWGKRLFRRLLTGEEIDQYVQLASVTGQGDPWVGLESALGTMLESPNFVYRLDAIEPDPTSPGRSRFTAYATASRLSFLLWGSTPDDALLDAAERGELSTVDQVRRHVDRMMASDKGQAGILHFFDEWLDVSAIDHVEKDKALFPGFTPELRRQLQEQISLTIKDLMWDRGQSFLDLFLTRDIFMSPGLASLYGVQPPKASGFTRITLDGAQPRAGLLGWAGVLALQSRPYASSPTLRGLFVRERLLCQSVGSPPPDATQQQPQEVNGVPLTTRQRAEARLSNPNCSGCHARMDGIGLGLENFDAVGQYRTSEGTTPIDASGKVNGVPFDGALDLAKILRDLPEVDACGARHLFRYATGRMETRDEEMLVHDLATKFARVDHRMKAMFAEIVASDAFLRPKTIVQGGK